MEEEEETVKQTMLGKIFWNQQEGWCDWACVSKTRLREWVEVDSEWKQWNNFGFPVAKIRKNGTVTLSDLILKVSS